MTADELVECFKKHDEESKDPLSIEQARLIIRRLDFSRNSEVEFTEFLYASLDPAKLYSNSNKENAFKFFEPT